MWGELIDREFQTTHSLTRSLVQEGRDTYFGNTKYSLYKGLAKLTKYRNLRVLHGAINDRRLITKGMTSIYTEEHAENYTHLAVINNTNDVIFVHWIDFTGQVVEREGDEVLPSRHLIDSTTFLAKDIDICDESGSVILLYLLPFAVHLFTFFLLQVVNIVEFLCTKHLLGTPL